MGGAVGSRAGLDVLEKRKISEPYRDSKHQTVQPEAQSLCQLRYSGSHRSTQIFRRPSSHLKILGARRVISPWGQMLGVTVKNSVARATLGSGFVHLWFKIFEIKINNSKSIQEYNCGLKSTNSCCNSHRRMSLSKWYRSRVATKRTIFSSIKISEFCKQSEFMLPIRLLK
jgi:hypothetical protein